MENKTPAPKNDFTEKTQDALYVSGQNSGHSSWTEAF